MTLGVKKDLRLPAFILFVSYNVSCQPSRYQRRAGESVGRLRRGYSFNAEEGGRRRRAFLSARRIVVCAAKKEDKEEVPPTFRDSFASQRPLSTPPTRKRGRWQSAERNSVRPNCIPSFADAEGPGARARGALKEPTFSAPSSFFSLSLSLLHALRIGRTRCWASPCARRSTERASTT